MAMFVHLSPASRVAAIRRNGISRLRKPRGDFPGGVYAVPVTRNFFVSHQWLRELKRNNRGPIAGVYFRIPDDEQVLVGHYQQNRRWMTAAQATAEFMSAEDPQGWEVIIPRRIEAGELHRVRELPQVVGWRYFPKAKGKAPTCLCRFCVTRGEYGMSNMWERRHVKPMLFGDRKDFAIEAGPEPMRRNGREIKGRVCVWIRGGKLGDIKHKDENLERVLLAMERAVDQLPTLKAPELAGMSSTDVWYFFCRVLIGFRDDVALEDHRTDAEFQADMDRWSRHEFLGGGEGSFERFSSFIVLMPDEKVLLLYQRQHSRMRAVEVTRAGFESAVRGFGQWIEAQKKRRLD